ncbi:NlpC/P60 family protein [Rhizobacter sp. Root1221]|uniref:NlpC/P60 family protein n=1 Tax=Rhizobacter sp. Root1221 TaxID=1736433 RepID=UPI0009E96716|nr:NlpC/P60 family protein [Rhizobacter sp. Root1221]
MTVRHWATVLIGRAWTPDFHCWALVRLVFAQRYGIAMPDVAVATDDNVRAIKGAAEASGWRPGPAPAQDGDIVLMQGPFGRHVGVIISTPAGLRLLHNDGHMSDRGPRGGVVAQPLADATRDGYHRYEFWRRSL